MAGKLILKITAGALTLALIGAMTSVITSADSLADYQKRQHELDEKAAQYQAVINSTASDIKQREEYKTALLNKITVLNEQIANGREQINSLDKEILELQKEIDESRGKISGRIDKLKQRVRVLYMSGDTTSLEIILGAKDFGDFLDKLEIVTYISRSDKALIDSLQKDIDVINEKRDSLSEKKTALANEQKQLSERQKEMQKLISENEKLLDNLYVEHSGAQDSLDETNEERKEIEDKITAYFKNKEAQAETARIASEAQKKLAEQKAASSKTSSAAASSKTSSSQTSSSPAVVSSKAASSQNVSSQNTTSEYEDEEPYYEPEEPEDSDDYTYSIEPSSSQPASAPIVSSEPEPEPEPQPQSSGYVWPVPGHYTLSSVWNEDRTTYNHGAIDISDGSIFNAQVVAAESGVVILCENSCEHNYGKDGSCGCGGGYGRYIMIDHGNGKATLYAHMTSVAVNSGDYVQKGQLVGYVGSTGWSTGPHLHFETRLNGEKYNPMTEYPNI